MFSNDTNHSQHRRNWERTYRVDLDAVTKRNLRGYMGQELQYYNSMVTAFNSKVRVLYEEISAIKDDRLWLAVAQTGQDLRELVKKPVDAWPDLFKHQANTIAKDGKLLLSDRTMMVYDIAAAKGIIHPMIRRAIAAEIFRWVQPQAKQLAMANESITGQMRSPLQMLQPMEIEHKRHVQLVGDVAQITYDAETKSSSIKIPYSPTCIVIDNQDLTKMPHDNIIIRQKPGVVPNESTPWQITIKEGTGRYQLDLTDMSPIPLRKPKRQ